MAFLETASKTSTVSFPAGDYSVNYEIHGSGPTKLALIMGFQASMAAWQQIVSHFSRDPLYSILALDNRGVGKSRPGNLSRYSTTGLARDFLSVLDDAGNEWKNGIHLIGCSMGGMIAQEACVLQSARFKSLVLVATCSKFKSPEPTTYEMLLRMYNFVRPKKDLEEKLDVLMWNLYSDESWLNAYDERYPRFKDNRARQQNVFAERWSSQEPSGLNSFIGQSFAVQTHNCSQDKLKLIGEAIPIKVAVAGTEDRMMCHTCTDYLSTHIPGCRSIKLQGRGHGIPTESEFELIKIIEEVLEASMHNEQ